MTKNGSGFKEQHFADLSENSVISFDWSQYGPTLEMTALHAYYLQIQANVWLDYMQ